MLAAVALTATVLGSLAGTALGSGAQQALFQDDDYLWADPQGALDAFRALGVGVTRLSVRWSKIAPAANASQPPRGFDGSDPGAYPAANWATLDQIVRAAAVRKIALEFTVSGPGPAWALGSAPRGGPPGAWKPSAKEFGAFVRAVAARYSGSYTPQSSSTPLPRVGFWEIWNEPNFGLELAPQAINRSKVLVSPIRYRALLDAAWSALRQSGHGRDTVLIGALAARGARTGVSHRAPQGRPGNFGMTKPLEFVRALYCVDSKDQVLRGASATASGCPTSSAGSGRFRHAHPALFDASGISDHPYPFNLPPTKASTNDADFTEFSQLTHFEHELDHMLRAYGSHARYPVYLTEYGYITRPPDRGRFVSPETAARYINWAEYLAWLDPRIRTTAQYLLYDPNPYDAPEYGGFASGLIFYDHTRKPAYGAYRLPLFLPKTELRRERRFEVWGCVRPARYAQLDTGMPQSVQIQFASTQSSSFATLRTVSLTDPHGYFDLRMKFSSSGSVRLAWSDPSGTLAYSRVQRVTVK